jgi:hypothetical protein
VGTHLALVSEGGGPASEVLPVMSINADLAVVVILAVRAPDSLEKEHVEIHIDRVLLNQLNRQLALAVRERAEFLVLAGGAAWLEVRRAELGLVLIGVVKLLNPVVGTVAELTFGAVADFPGNLGADFGLVRTKGPSSVFVKVVIEGAALEVVILRVLLTLVDFECV